MGLMRRVSFTRALLPLFSTLLLGAESSLPWQSLDSRDQSVFEGLPPTVFAPGGRLHSVERFSKAAQAYDDKYSNLVVAVCCDEGTVLIYQAKRSPYVCNKLLVQGDDPTTVTTTKRRALTAGNVVDSQILLRDVHSLIESRPDSSTRGLARALADQLQIRTQSSNRGRILASCAILADPYELWRVDPTGQFFQCHATAIGRDSHRALDFLAQQDWEQPRTLEAALELGRQSIQNCYLGNKKDKDKGEETIHHVILIKLTKAEDRAAVS